MDHSHHQDIWDSRTLDKEVSIRFRPRTALKLLFFVVFFLISFYLGRWSLEECPASASAPAQTLTPPSVEKEESGFFSQVLSSFTGLFASDEEPETPPVKNTSLTNASSLNQTSSPSSSQSTSSSSSSASASSASNTSASSSAASSSAEETDEETETIITSYSQVFFSIDKVKTEWHDTWGKIIYFEYTIKNNEVGTIKPDRFVMNVEGYMDFDKKVPLPASSQSLKSKTTAKSTAFVPSGFAYSELSAGSLRDVEITFKLLDSSNKEMAVFKGMFDLSGVSS